MNKNQSTALFEQKSMYYIQMDFKAHTNFLINDFSTFPVIHVYCVFCCFVLFFAVWDLCMT